MINSVKQFTMTQPISLKVMVSRTVCLTAVKLSNVIFTLFDKENIHISCKIAELESNNQRIKSSLEQFKLSFIERSQVISLLNKKLEVYAFSNSHKVRAPLARLLGLTRLLQMNGVQNKEKNDVYQKLLVEAEELEIIINNITRALEKEVKAN